MDSSSDSEAARFMEYLCPLERELELYCRRMVWKPEDAPDVVQNAVLRAFKAFDRYREGTNFRAWMFKILTNEIFAFNRKHARLARLEYQLPAEEIEVFSKGDLNDVEDEAVTDLDAIKEQLDDRLVEGLRMLTEAERAVLLMRAIARFSYQEMSESLEVPMGTVMGNLARARQKMRKLLTKRGWRKAL